MFRKYFYLLETLIGLTCLVVIDFATSDPPNGFIGVFPHPYWSVLLLISCRYGAFEGLLAGTILAFSYIVLGTKSQVVDFSSVTFPYGAYIHPFFFMLVGGVTGQMRSIYKRKHGRLNENYNEARADLSELGTLHSTVLKSKQQLERRIAFQSNTMMNMIERLNSMETVDPDKIYQGIPDLLLQQLNAKCASVYRVDGNDLLLLRREGEHKNQVPERLDLTEGMMGRAVQTQKVVSISHVFSDEDLRKEDIVMSAPIVLSDNSVLGVMNVEKLSFYDLTLNTEKLFEMLSHWLALVLERALHMQDLKDKNIEDEITGAYNYLYFQKRLTYEVDRALRYKYPLSLLLLTLDAFQEKTSTKQKKTLVVMNQLFKGTLRHADIIFKYRDSNTYAALLPHTSLAGAEVAIRRLREQIEAGIRKGDDETLAELNLHLGVSAMRKSDKDERGLRERSEVSLRTGVVQELNDELCVDLSTPAWQPPPKTGLQTSVRQKTSAALVPEFEEFSDLEYILGPGFGKKLTTDLKN